MPDDLGGAPLFRRGDFPVTDDWIYLNNAGRAPLSRPAADALVSFATASAGRGCLAFDEQMASADHTRVLAGQLLGVDPGEVAFVKNTTEGLAFIANGYPWMPGDRILVPDCEFPSTSLAFGGLAARGVDVELVPSDAASGALPLEAYQRLLARWPHPTMVVTSWVQFARGWRTDLPALASACHEVGALLCVNAIQGLGVLPARFGEIGVDLAVADGHKWLLGPEGAGVLYVASNLLERIAPTEPGWNSVAPRNDWSGRATAFDPTARRYEGGSLNLAGIAALGASMALTLDAGVDAIWRYVDARCTQLVSGLEAAGRTVVSDRGEGRSGIVTFASRHTDPTELCARLRGCRVVAAPRAGGVRLSPHAYVSPSDVDTALDAIDRCDRPRPPIHDPDEVQRQVVR